MPALTPQSTPNALSAPGRAGNFEAHRHSIDAQEKPLHETT